MTELKQKVRDFVTCARDNRDYRAVRAVFVTSEAYDEIYADIPENERFIDDELLHYGYENVAVAGVAVCRFVQLGERGKAPA